MLAHKPGFALVAVIALALGIGANSAIFSVVNAVLLRPLPFRDPGRLVALWETNAHGSREGNFVCPSNYLDWKDRNRTFAQMAALRDLPFTLTGSGDPEELRGQRVSWDLFPLLGIAPILGRAFDPAEDQPGRDTVVILSHRLWARRFGAERGVLGSRITLDHRQFTVIGVMPPGFQVLNSAAELWIPLALNRSEDYRRTSTRNLAVLARLLPGVTRNRAETELQAIAQRLADAHPGANRGWSVKLVGLREELVGNVRSALLVLLAAVGFLLLIACSNIANLLLVRYRVREKEIAIRIALGAGGRRLLRQLLTESVLLGAAGGALGLVLAFWGVRLVIALGPKNIPRLEQVSPDGTVLLFTLGVSLLTGILFGLAPALHCSSPNLNEALKSGGRRSAADGARPAARLDLRGALVMCEVALTVVLLIGAGLLVRSFGRLLAVDPGFNPHNILTLKILLSSGRNSSPEARVAFFQRLVQSVGGLPGVRSVTGVDQLPLSGFGYGVTFAVDGRGVSSPTERPIALVRAAHPGYFATVGIPLLAGRRFDERDGRESPRVILINETLARRFCPPGETPLGRTLIIQARETLRAEIVGVVGDVKAEGLGAGTWPTLYSPHAQFPATSMTLVVQTESDPKRLAGTVARQIYLADPDQPVAEIRTMDEVLSDSVSQPRFNMMLLSTFAALAVVLATVGIYGVVAYNMSQRTHEIGLRMALGASRGGVLRLVVGQAAWLIGAGVALGLAAAAAVTHLMAGLLYGIGAVDAVTFTSIPALLGAVGLVASLLPALAATRVDPIVALRHE